MFLRSWMRSLPAAACLRTAVACLLAAIAPGKAFALGPHVAGEILVKFKAGVSAVQSEAALGELGAWRLRQFSRIGVQHVRLERGQLEDALARFRSDPRVAYAEPNFQVRAALTPNDPMFDQLYALHNKGQTGGVPGADIAAPDAWDVLTGDPTFKIGVLDGGVDYAHPDLSGNVWVNLDELVGEAGVDDDVNGFVDDLHGYDFVGDDGDPDDTNGHGSLVAGVIAAQGNNGVGVTGVNWRASLVAIKFLDSANVGSVAGAIAAIDYAILMGLRLTCNSWGTDDFSQALLDAIDAAGAAGQLFVTAAGNDGRDIDATPSYPASYGSPHVLTVAATDASDALAPFSNFGARAVDLAAPGSDIVSTDRLGLYLIRSGTSFAAAYVTGVCALMMERFPALNHLQIKEAVLAAVDPRPGLMGRVATGGRLNALRSVAGPDRIAPAAITDLAASDPGSNTMGLTWTATGDDSTRGVADRYDIRYARTPITEANFEAASFASGPGPAPSGSSESHEVGGLDVLTTYYFAIKALDESGNPGPISNVAAGTTLEAPDIEVGPASLAVALLTGQMRTETLQLVNASGGTLDFTVPRPELVFDPIGTVGGWDAGGVTSDESTARRRGVGAEATGGPDGFGYVWVDGDQLGGPMFEWVDITGVGTRLALEGDDTSSDPVGLGMRFPFYGNYFDSVRISTNGSLSFTDGSSPFLNRFLPHSEAPSNLVAPLWDDLDAGATQRVYVHNDGTRFVVSWIEVPHFGGGGPYTFQVLFYPSGEIRFQYRSVGTRANEATVGIQNATRNVGLTVVFNADYLRDSLAVRIVPTALWLAVSPPVGRVRPGGQQSLEVRFDASGLSSSDLNARIQIWSNDPDESTIGVPVSLHVVGAPRISLSASALAFDTVYVGDTATRVVVVTNTGAMTLNVSEVESGDPALSASPVSFLVEPGESQPIEVRYQPIAPGDLQTSLTIRNNDILAPVQSIPVSGASVVQPIIGVDPDSLTVTLATNRDTTRTLTVSNTGGADLWFTVTTLVGSETAVEVYGEADHVAQGKGDPDRVFGPEPLNSGGPDAFGYTFVDSDEPGGPGFAWIDVRTTGTQLPMVGDDVNTGPFPIGFNFPFYEATFDSFRICTNGFVTFTGLQSTFLNTALPNNAASVPPNLLAVLWDDFNILTPSTYYHSDSSRLVIQFHEVPRLGETAKNTFEVVLYPDGRILYQYLSIQTALTNSNTIGIQNATRDDGLQVAFNQPYVRDSLAVLFRRPARFLSVHPTGATLPPGGQVDLTVTFDATALLAGVYNARIHFESNDPVTPVLDVAASLTVLGVPDIVVSPTSLSFDSVFTGYSRDRVLRIDNIGSDVLNITQVTSDDPAYSASPTTAAVPPFGHVEVTVTFLPTVARLYPATLTISSDDPDRPELAVNLSGVGVPPPQVQVSPATLSAALANSLTPEALVRVVPLVIENHGGSRLEWGVGASVSTLAYPSPPGLAEISEPLDVQPPKGDPGVPGAATILASGGPDGFGYRWSDSDAPGGPVFSWKDVTGVGTRIPFARDDQNSGPIALPFSFPFYGTWFDTVYVCTNGWLSFTSRDSTYHNVGLPNPGTRTPANLIAPFWDDLDFRTSGNVYYHFDGARFIVSFIEVPHWIYPGPPPPGIYTFQVWLDPSGEINYQYLTLIGQLTSVTVGIQNGAKDTGLQVVYNGVYLHDSLRTRVTRLPEWLSATPSFGATPPGGRDTIQVRLDAEGLFDGDHAGNVSLVSNDPVTAALNVPVALHVGVTPAAFRLGVELQDVNPVSGWIAGRVSVEGSCDPQAIRISSVRVAGAIPVADGAPADAQGCEAIVRFDRRSLLTALGEGEEVVVDVVGELADVTWFSGRDTVRNLPPSLTRPADPYEGGSTVALAWTDASGSPPSHYDLRYSPDEGATWFEVATGTNAPGLDWIAPRGGAAAGWLELMAFAEADGSFVGADYSGPFEIQPNLIAVDNPLPERLGIRLAGTHPGPGNALLELAVPSRGSIEVHVYDVRGALVHRIATGEFEPGRHRLRWDGRDASGRTARPGVYFIRAASTHEVSRLRFVLLR